AVAESRERVRAALAALGLALPARHITVNLAPADVLKEGSHFDLPIALGLLGEMGVLPQEELQGYTALGELALDGSLTGVAGVLLAALAAAARDSGIICPVDCGGEAAWAGEVEVIAAPSLLAIVNHFKGTQLLPPPEPRLAPSRSAGLDLADVKGQESAKRALEIAAAGGHNLLMVGPPGAGKSMLAARLPGILPPLEPAEALELGMIQSVAGGLRSGGLSRERPFRDPHHSASLAALRGRLPGPAVGPVARPHRPAHRRPGGGAGRSGAAARRRGQRGGRRPGRDGPCPAGPALCGAARRARHPHQCRGGRGIAGRNREPRRRRPRAARPGGRAAAPLGARLPPGDARRPHPGGPRRRACR